MKELTELTYNAGVVAWIPTEAWADLILEASVCYGQLSGVITCVDFDLAAGNGHVVNVRAVPSRATVACKTYDCECLAVVSTYLTHEEIVICQMGMMDSLCGYSFWQAKGPAKEMILNEMAKGLAASRDYAIVAALGVGATPYRARTAVTYTSTANSSVSCCDFAFNIYNCVVSVAAHMRAHCKKPDVVIINPEIGKWFYTGDRGGEHAMHVQFDQNDKLIKIGGMKVIETGHMPLRTAGVITLAYIIDSSRAVGEAWGMRPTFTEVYNNQCNRYDETVWQYWGCSLLSVADVGKVYSA